MENGLLQNSIDLYRILSSVGFIATPNLDDIGHEHDQGVEKNGKYPEYGNLQIFR